MRNTAYKSGNYFDYTYDSRGNITQVKKNGSAYTYDAQNQLLSETYGGKTWTYTYDKAGNILSVSDGTTTNSYGYSTSWGDLLTSYKGTAITYDNAGNPLSYYNGKNYTFTWTEGNRLASAVVNNTTTSYTYTEGGIRNSKTVGGVKTSTIWMEAGSSEKTATEQSLITTMMTWGMLLGSNIIIIFTITVEIYREM